MILKLFYAFNVSCNISKLRHPKMAMTFGLVKLEDDMAIVTELAETDLAKLVFHKNLRNKSIPTVSQSMILRIFLILVYMHVIMYM